MAIGNFGSLITFETNDRRILSPQSFKAGNIRKMGPPIPGSGKSPFASF